MTTERRAMAQINKRRQEIKERLTLDVKWQAQIKTGGMTSLEVGNEGRVTGVGGGMGTVGGGAWGTCPSPAPLVAEGYLTPPPGRD